MGGMRNAYKILFGKPEGKREPERPRHRWQNNIRMDMGYEDVDWIHVAQNRECWQVLVSKVMNFGLQ
jgi:hypothetical protein